MKKNTQGSGIIWAIAAIMILSVIVAGALTFAYYNFHTTMANAERMQLELDAKAATASLVKALEQGQSLTVLVPSDVGEKKDITITMPEGMSMVSTSYIERTGDKKICIYVSVASSKNEVNVKGYMDYNNGKWVLNYYDGGGASS